MGGGRGREGAQALVHTAGIRRMTSPSDLINSPCVICDLVSVQTWGKTAWLAREWRLSV